MVLVSNSDLCVQSLVIVSVLNDSHTRLTVPIQAHVDTVSIACPQRAVVYEDMKLCCVTCFSWF